MKKDTQELIQNLKANGLNIITLAQYEEAIAQWGFAIHKPFLERMAASNSSTIESKNGDIHFNYLTSQAVLAQKISDKYVGYANVQGYEVMPKDDPRRNAFSDFRKNEVYFTYKGKIWTI